jgi:hypothetical protein
MFHQDRISKKPICVFPFARFLVLVCLLFLVGWLVIKLYPQTQLDKQQSYPKSHKGEDGDTNVVMQIEKY